jgi:hypothetical protein
MENTNAVLAAESWCNVKRDTIETILSQDKLCGTSEIELFSACVRWAKANDTDAREALGPVLKLIRFRTFTPLEFATIACPSRLLTAIEESDIFCCLVLGTNNMPEGFSTLYVSRGIDEEIVEYLVDDWNVTTPEVEEAKSVVEGIDSNENISEEISCSNNSNTELSVTERGIWDISNDGSYCGSVYESDAGSECTSGNRGISASPLLNAASSLIVQGTRDELINNGYLGPKDIITLRYTGGSTLVQDGHAITQYPVTFSVNAPAYITAVDLLSWQHNNTNTSNLRYKESVKIKLKNSVGKVVAQGKFAGKSSRQKRYRVYFYNPYCVSPNVSYRLYIHFTDLKICHSGYQIAIDKTYETSWGLEVKILDGDYTQLRAIQFASKMK